MTPTIWSSSSTAPISDIFYNEGETAFRRYERDALDRVLGRRRPGVVALGGGALSVEESLEAAEKASYRVFIKVIARASARAMRRSKWVRPLLGPTPSLARIKELYAKRMPQYAHADYVVEADVSEHRASR